MAALDLPAPPFNARTRRIPVTLVNERGLPVLVLETLAVRVQVQQVRKDRVLVSCTGCRTPVEGWLQIEAVVPRESALAGLPDRYQDRLVAAVELAAHPADGSTPVGALAVLDHGLVAAEGGWLAPPWHAEGGYAGPVVAVKGGGATQVLREGVPSAPPPDPNTRPPWEQGP